MCVAPGVQGTEPVMSINLVQHQSQPNVWENFHSKFEGDAERKLIAVTAGACLFAGLRFRRRSGYRSGGAAGCDVPPAPGRPRIMPIPCRPPIMFDMLFIVVVQVDTRCCMLASDAST